MVCENQELANDKLGASVTAKLQDRLADIVAASTIFDVILGNPKQSMVGTVIGYKIELTNSFILSIVPGHLKPTYMEDGKVNWNKVTRIKIYNIAQEQ